MVRRSLVVASAAALTAIALVGCSPATSTEPTSSPIPTHTEPPTPSVTSPAAPCELTPTSTLQVPQPVTVIVELTNSGTGECALRGNPTVTFLDNSGNAVQVAVNAGSGEQFSGEPVTVVPGGHAYLTFLTDTAGSCAPTGAVTLVIGVSGAPSTTKVDLGSTTFCPPSADVETQSYPVTDQPELLT